MARDEKGQAAPAPFVAMLFLGLSFSLMSPGNAVADPFGDAAATGWDQQTVDAYRGFFLPGVTPTTAELDPSKVMRQGTPCGSREATARPVAVHAAESEADGPTPLCRDARNKLTDLR